MPPKTRCTFAAMAAISAALVPAAGASAASLRGVVVHQDARAHSFVLAGARGRLAAVHARHLPAVGRSVTVNARRLRNGTWVAQRVRLGHRASQVRMRGTVTYVDAGRGTFVLSTRGASLLVHERTSVRHDVLLTSDSGVHAGEVVVVEGRLEHDALDATSLRGEGQESSGIGLEGTVESIDPATRTLSVSADDDGETGTAISVGVPSSFDLGAFTVGEPVELSVSRNADGTYKLEQASDDSGAGSADDPQGIQGEDHGSQAHGDHARGEDGSSSGSATAGSDAEQPEGGQPVPGQAGGSGQAGEDGGVTRSRGDG
jgi:hypothetical protein